MKDYCTQNNGDCKTCSLQSYNRDCHNNAIHGGVRIGSGRKKATVERRPRPIRLSDDEYTKVKEFIKKMRENV